MQEGMVVVGGEDEILESTHSTETCVHMITCDSGAFCSGAKNKFLAPEQKAPESHAVTCTMEHPVFRRFLQNLFSSSHHHHPLPHPSCMPIPPTRLPPVVSILT